MESEKSMKETIGILGGSFNPIHYGHIQMAQAAMKCLSLDRFFFLPAGDPPHKSTELAPKEHRLHMLTLALQNQYEICSLEMEREGKSYTVDTLEALHEQYADAEFFLIIGADTLQELPTWRHAQRVYSLCTFAVVARDQYGLSVPEGVRAVFIEQKVAQISATEIRERVSKGLSLFGWTPKPVREYIGEHRLYAPPAAKSERQIMSSLQKILPQARYGHTLGTQERIVTLARRWQYDEKKASLTALLHDCAKGMPLSQMQAFCERQGACIDPLRTQNIMLLHAMAGAELARSAFGITDPEIEDAIAYHNTGKANMSLLLKLLMLADYTEPTRKNFAGLEEVRELCMQDVDRALIVMLRQRLLYIKKEKALEHPDSRLALTYIIKNQTKNRAHEVKETTT